MLFTYGAVTPERSLYLATPGDAENRGRISSSTNQVEMCRVELDPGALAHGQILFHSDFVRIFTVEGGCSLSGSNDPKFDASVNFQFDEGDAPYVLGQTELGNGGTLKFIASADPLESMDVASILPIALGGETLSQSGGINGSVVFLIGDQGTVATYREWEGGYCVLSYPSWDQHVAEQQETVLLAGNSDATRQCNDWAGLATERRSEAYRKKREDEGELSFLKLPLNQTEAKAGPCA